MKPSKIRRRLDLSLGSGRIATVVRDRFEIMMTDGFVIAVTDQWVVLHTLDDGVHLDDIVMLRLRDISAVLFRDDNAYHRRGVAALGEPVAAFQCETGVTAADLLKVASAGGNIVAIHLETLKGDPLTIGRVIRLRKRSFELHYVGRDGVWARETERWKYRDVTRIELGGRYLVALNRFADSYPLKPDKAHRLQPVANEPKVVPPDE